MPPHPLTGFFNAPRPAALDRSQAPANQPRSETPASTERSSPTRPTGFPTHETGQFGATGAAAGEASVHADAQPGLAQVASTRLSGWSTSGARSLPASIAGPERAYAEASHALTQLEAQLAGARQAVSTLDEKAGWKESFLWGAFGDRSLRSDLKASRQSVQSLETQVASAKDVEHAAWEGYRTALTRALLAERPELAPRKKQLDALAHAVEWGTAALASVRRGLRETDDAQSMETADLATNNAGFSVLSSIEMDEVREQLGVIRENLAGLEQAVSRARSLGAQTPDGKVSGSLVAVDDFPDFVLDVALSAADFGSFDFLSWQNLGRLDELEDGLARLEQRLESVVEKLGEVHVQAAEGWDAHLDAFRARFE